MLKIKHVFRALLGSIICLLMTTTLSQAFWNYTGGADWGLPSNHLGTQYEPWRIITVPMEAIVSEDPDEITLKFYSQPDAVAGFSDTGVYDTDLTGTYEIYRKDPNATSWGSALATIELTDDITTWTDTNVTPGIAYEYGLYATVIPDGPITTTLTFAHGNVIAGINVDRTETKGRIVVVVADDIITELPVEYAQYKADLVRDGWIVHEITTPRALDYTSNGTGPDDANGVPTAPFPDEHINIRNQIIQIYTDHPGEVKNVSLIGRVAVARSGINSIGPDGHGNRNSAGADAYYADMDGVWTDTGNNLSNVSGGASTGVKQGTVNVAGDNKFDQGRMNDLPDPSNKRLELGFGRIDFSHVIGGEYASTRNYFNKLHRYKTASPDFQPGRRAIYRSGFGAITHLYLGAMPGVVGMEQMDFLLGAERPTVPDNFDSDAAYTADDKPYLFYFKGNSGPAISHGGQAVFWTGMQSHWGYWFETTVTSGQNAMQRRLAEDNFTLSYTWSIGLFAWDVNYLYHRFGMGGNAGDMLRVSMSDRKIANPLYTKADAPTFMNHMGDPALRLFMFPPPTDLQVIGNTNPSLSWTASTAPVGEPQVMGYHVYRSDSATGPYTRLTATPIAGTSYVDASADSGEWYYQVKAIRLEQTGGGTYYNSSLAAQQSIDLDATPGALAISTAATLPDANWDTEYNVQLSVGGGTPLYAWQIASGSSLPTGLALSNRGLLSGKPSVEGDFNFTLEVTDALAGTTQQAFSLSISGLDMQVLDPEASSYVKASDTDYSARAYEPYLQVSDLYNSYLRFDLSGVNQNVNFVSAKLVLTIDDTSTSGNNVEIKASLGHNSDDDWDEWTVTFDDQPSIDEATPTQTGDTVAEPGETVTIDVSYMVYNILLNDPSKKFTVRLHSDDSTSWLQWARVINRHATSEVRPKLIIQTAGVEGFDPPPTPPPPPAPVAAFSAFPVSGRAPLEVTFTDESTGAINDRSWDFGDGTTLDNTTETSVTHTYTTVGAYTVGLTAHGPGGDNLNTQTDVVEVQSALDGIRLEINPDPLDRGRDTAGGATWAGQTSVRIGSGNSEELNQGYVMPFWIPDLEGDTILAAELTLTQVGEGAAHFKHYSDVDLIGARSHASSATTLATDFTDPGTMLIDNWFPIQPGLVHDIGIAKAEDGALLTWLQQQVGTTGQKFVFITVRPDTIHSSKNYYYTFETAEGATFPPKLVLTVGTPGGETETITIWRQAHFGTDQPTGPAADGAIPMGDGLPNLIKYALGLDPMTNYATHAQAPKLHYDDSEGYLYTLTRKSSRDDVTLVLEVSDGLMPTAWTAIDPLMPTHQVSVQEDTPEVGMQTITIRTTAPTGDEQYIRLKATY